jgi:hypothetical protein
MIQRRQIALLLFAFFLFSWTVSLTHAAQQSHTVVLAGHSGELAVVVMGGRNYVELEGLARLANGSLSFRGNQIVLTLPASNSGGETTGTRTSEPVSPGFSKEFLKAGIELMSVIREWRSTLTNAVQRGFPITEDWITTFSTRGQSSLRLATVAASTESDRNAEQLLTNEFKNMKKLSDRFVKANESRDYISPNALDNDPLDQKILNCAHSLAAMATNNQFVDDGSCSLS